MAISYNSNYDLTIPFSDVCAQITLEAGVEQIYAVPGPNIGATYSVRFTYNDTSNVYVCVNDTPVIPLPGAGVNTQQYCEFKPGYDGSQRYVKAGDVLHFITPNDTVAYVGISLRQIPS